MEKQATRVAYGKTLAALGEEKMFFVLDADLSGSTNTKTFGDKFPERFFNCGIAEGNMMSVAAGMAAAGVPVFASSFAMFATGRAFEQIRNSVGYPKLNVKIAASHAGITVGEDGASHQCIEDISLMRGIPGMTVFCPADSAETEWAVKKALEIDGPVYIRLGRYAVEQVFTDCSSNEIGKGNVVADGTDIAIFATGITVASAVKARAALADKGVSAAVVDIHTIKPFDKELANYYASRCGIILTTEEHSVIGGLGSAVCEAVCETTPCKVVRLGINDEFGTSASAGVLVSHFGLDAEGITAKALAALGK